MNNEPEKIEGEEQEVAEKEPSKSPFLHRIFDYVELFTLAMVAVLVLFSFCFRLCRVDGGSMNNTLANGERVITTDLFYTPKSGDIVVFHLINDHYKQPLVKRVIATEGQTVKINFVKNQVFVDGVLFDDSHAYFDGGLYRVKSDFDRQYIFKDETGDLVFEATVPEGHVFVMGDNRNHSTDSRSTLVGFVSEDSILGKVVLRLSPFTTFD